MKQGKGGSAPYFDVVIQTDELISAPLDLGADATIMSKEFYDSLKEKLEELELIPHCAKLYDVNGGNVRTFGRCWLDLRFG